MWHSGRKSQRSQSAILPASTRSFFLFAAAIARSIRGCATLTLSACGHSRELILCTDIPNQHTYDANYSAPSLRHMPSEAGRCRRAFRQPSREIQGDPTWPFDFERRNQNAIPKMLPDFRGCSFDRDRRDDAASYLQCRNDRRRAESCRRTNCPRIVGSRV